MLQAKPRFFLVLRHHSRGRAGEATGEQNTDAHSVPDTQAFCNTGRNDPQAISLGTIHRDEVTEKKPHAAQGWKDRVRRDGVVCATNWDN